MKKTKISGKSHLKKKTKKLLQSSLLLLAIFVVILLVRIFSSEDAWICKEGKWQKHGNPASPKPTTQCALIRN